MLWIRARISWVLTLPSMKTRGEDFLLAKCLAHGKQDNPGNWLEPRAYFISSLAAFHLALIRCLIVDAHLCDTKVDSNQGEIPCSSALVMCREVRCHLVSALVSYSTNMALLIPRVSLQWCKTMAIVERFCAVEVLCIPKCYFIECWRGMIFAALIVVVIRGRYESATKRHRRN